MNYTNNAGTPAIHMNGSSKEALLTEWEDFAEALENLVEKFPFESFHPRNHYVKDGDGEGLAEACKAEMMEHIFTLKQTAHEIYEGIYNQ